MGEKVENLVMELLVAFIMGGVGATLCFPLIIWLANKIANW